MTSGILQDVHYYDMEFDEQNGVLELDRVYTFDDDCFKANDYRRLEAIYPQLPGFLTAAEWPCWFGQDAEDEFYLAPSWEPPGLQLYGRVQIAEFTNWEKTFHELLLQANFPYRKL